MSPKTKSVHPKVQVNKHNNYKEFLSRCSQNITFTRMGQRDEKPTNSFACGFKKRFSISISIKTCELLFWPKLFSLSTRSDLQWLNHLFCANSSGGFMKLLEPALRFSPSKSQISTAIEKCFWQTWCWQMGQMFQVGTSAPKGVFPLIRALGLRGNPLNAVLHCETWNSHQE